MMKHFFALAFSSVIAALPAFGAEGVVSADLLNLRQKPEIKSAVVLKLKKGEKVEILGESGEFFELAAPATTPAYISGVFIANGKTTRELEVHARGAKDAPVLGKLPSGSAVKVIEVDRYGWAKIEPAADLKLYAAKRYIKLSGDAAAVKPVEDKKPDTPPVEDKKPDIPPVDDKKPDTPVEAPAEIPEDIVGAFRRIGIDMEKPRSVTAYGSFVKLENTPVAVIDYALLRKSGDTQYYVCTGKFDVSKLGEREVRVTGRVFHVPNWQIPVLYVDSVSK